MMRYVSPSVTRLTGYRPEEILGSQFLGYVHPDDAEAFMRSLVEDMKNPGARSSRNSAGGIRTAPGICTTLTARTL